MENATGICLLIKSNVYDEELGTQEMLTVKFDHRRVAVFWDPKLYVSIRSRPILQTPGGKHRRSARVSGMWRLLFGASMAPHGGTGLI